MSSTLVRLARMPRAELATRLRERRDTGLERLAVIRGASFGHPHLSDDDAIVAAREHLGRGDKEQAGRSLARHFARRAPRFPLSPAGSAGVVRLIHASFPAAAAHARARADRIRGGAYDLLGYLELRFGVTPSTIDWHLDPVSGRRAPDGFWTSVPYLVPESGDHKVIWELNRHQHWLALGRAHLLTGSPAYRDHFVHELQSWLAANPPYRGVNWASMLELAFRSLSWIWALHLFVDADHTADAGWVVDLLGGLESQLDHVARHLSWFFSPNTHLLGEGLALYVAGQALPELARSAAWADLGRKVLLRERHAQVHPDGGHAEQSLHYHRYALDFYLLALSVARRTGDPATDAFEDTARRMATFARRVADGTGRLMTIGDDDGGMLFPMCGGAPWDVSPSLAVAAALLDDPSLQIGPPREEAIWMTGRANAGPSPVEKGVGSVYFPNTGYAVLADDRTHVIFDAGPHGFLNGGHAHADALAIAASLDGLPLLIDPGTATYTMDPAVRDRFRSTPMHNTVTIGGRDQSIPRGPFHWKTRTDARLTRWITGPGADFVEGEHDAYAPVRHQRAVLRASNLLLVADHVRGDGACPIALHWHIHPDWRIAPAGRWTDLSHDRTTVSLGVSSGPVTPIAAERGGLGWIAPIYGQILPSTTLRREEQGRLPITLVTAVVLGGRGAMRGLERLEIDGVEAKGSAEALAIEDGLGTAIVLFSSRPVGAPPSPLVVTTPSGRFSSDARAALLQLSVSGEPESLLLVDATHAAWSGAGGFTITAPVAELLHLDSSVLRQLSRKDEPRW
jgi:hypothetical protein